MTGGRAIKYDRAGCLRVTGNVEHRRCLSYRKHIGSVHLRVLWFMVYATSTSLKSSFVTMRFCFLLYACGLVLFGNIHHASGQALATWYTTSGTQVVMQDVATGAFVYNIDSATGYGEMSSMSLTIPMKLGSPIASTGYAGGAGNIYVSSRLD